MHAMQMTVAVLPQVVKGNSNDFVIRYLLKSCIYSDSESSSSSDSNNGSTHERLPAAVNLSHTSNDSKANDDNLKNGTSDDSSDNEDNKSSFQSSSSNVSIGFLFIFNIENGLEHIGFFDL